MSAKTIGLSNELQAYILEHGTAPDPVLADLIRETRDRLGEQATMQIAPEQGPFLALLVRLTKARFAVEVGTFTGYSSICIARALPAGGRLACFDQSHEWTSIARRYWEKAGVSDRIELRLGDARETLRTLEADPEIDFAFIDADKPSYPTYYESVLARVARDGLIVVDNVLSRGRVLDPAQSENGAAIAAFNAAVAADERVNVVMLPVADGLSLITRKP